MVIKIYGKLIRGRIIGMRRKRTVQGFLKAPNLRVKRLLLIK